MLLLDDLVAVRQYTFPMQVRADTDLIRRIVDRGKGDGGTP